MTEVSTQITIESFFPDDIKQAVRSFADTMHHQMHKGGVLPGVRNRHEAYGYIAEQMGALSKSQRGIKSAIGNCESMLSSVDVRFADVSNELYDEALGLARDAVQMAICAQNIIFELSRNQPPTPLEDLADGAGLIDGLPDDETPEDEMPEDDEEEAEETEDE